MAVLGNKWTRLIFGSPLAKHQQAHERLTKFKALPILSSDALSSVAYATESILDVLAVAGAGALVAVMHISFFIAILILIVGFSYRQAISAYPNGGGSYTVAKENLGTFWGLVAAGSLLIDYVLTVAVSVTAGIYAITSAFPDLLNYATVLSVLAVLLVMWMNLRGMREAASAFAWPTYVFIVMMFLLIGVGLFHYLTGTLHPVVYSDNAMVTPLHALTILVLLRAFSSGCSAMTGIEVISNGVSTFKPPAQSNAMKTLLMLMILLIVMFLGTSVLASQLHIQPLEDNSVLSQIGEALLGHGFLYYLLQISTCAVLLLAANSSFAGFPLLASMISQNGYFPRQLQDLGDRLAFSNGIILLGVFAIVLIIMFNAQTNDLIPLYAIGVFVAFTLCQAGLVRVWFTRKHSRYWWLKAVINAIGCLATAIATLVIAESKFTEGAWIFFFALPAIMVLFYKIQRHYRLSDYELVLSADKVSLEDLNPVRPKVIVPVSMIHKGTLAALELAGRLSDDVTAISINVNPKRLEKLRGDWKRLKLPYKLVVLNTEYQSMVEPLLTRIRRMDTVEPERGLTIVVLTRALPSKLWHFLLHNHRILSLRMGLAVLGRENKGETRVIIEVPYHLKH